MAISSSPSKDPLFHSRRKSLSYDEIQLSSAVNKSTSVDVADAVRRVRRSRLSRDGIARCRSRSYDRAQAAPVFARCFNFARILIRDYIWPVVAWIITIIPAILTIVVVLALCSVIWEQVRNKAVNVACETHSDNFGAWVTKLPWPVRWDDTCEVQTQSAVQALFNDPTGVNALLELPGVAEWTEQIQKAAKQTALHIKVAINETRNFDVHLQRSEEVSKALGNWTQAHDHAETALYNLLRNERSFSTSLLYHIQNLRRQIADAEKAFSDTEIQNFLPTVVYQAFERTTVGEIVKSFKQFATDRASELEQLTALVPNISTALNKEDRMRNDLKVLLPLNKDELGEDVDLDELREFLQCGYRNWIRAARDTAERVAVQYEWLGKKFEDTYKALEPGARTIEGRGQLMRAVRRDFEGIRRTVERAEKRLADAIEERKALSLGSARKRRVE